ncbi:MAG: SCO family protein [Chitinophagaceae bacterium]|nr:SCO family protein [Chitinophagaceae bacterium]
MRKKWVLYTSFFVLLAVGFYFVMTKVIPGYGDVKLPVLSHVKPFTFTNQDGKKVSERDLEGKVYVAEYFFTTCTGICPKLNSNMKEVYEDFKDETGLVILSHTSDPDTDSVPVLKRYADSMQVNTQRWWFVTGRKDSLYNSARVSYLLDDPKNNFQQIDDQFLHTQFFALVDKAGQVRKIYDGLKDDEVRELKQDIAKLIKEPVSRKHFSNNLFGN